MASARAAWRRRYGTLTDGADGWGAVDRLREHEPMPDRRTVARGRRSTGDPGPGTEDGALRTGRLWASRTSWVWPWWLERQGDPASTAFVAAAADGGVTNLTGRSWTAVGTIASPRRAIVDPRGLVSPWPLAWSLDWWVEAGGTWQFPSRTASVRQGLVGTSPVVETFLRTPGGDVVARAYAVVAGDDERDDVVVVDVENRSSAPVAVAFVVRPYHPEGVAWISRIDVVGTTVCVDGAPAVLLPRPPARAVGATLNEGDLAVRLADEPSVLRAVACPDGFAQAAFVYPVLARSSVAVGLPAAADRSGSEPPGIEGRVAAAPRLPEPRPSPPAVARAWDAQVRRGLQLVLPPGRFSDVYEANRKGLLLSFGGGNVTAGPRPGRATPVADAAAILAAFERSGFHDEAAEVLLSDVGDRWLAAEAAEKAPAGEAAVGAALLVALGDHWRLTRDGTLASATASRVSTAARVVERAWRGRLEGRAARSSGSRPPELSALWRAERAMVAAAVVLGAVGETAAATRAGATAAWLAAAGRRIATDGAGWAGSDPRAVLGVCRPAGPLAADEPGLAQRLGQLRVVGAAVAGPCGLETATTARLARVEVARADRRAWDRLSWLVEAASDTLAWPESLHPTSGRGSGGDGHSFRAAAEFVTAGRELLVTDEPAAGGTASVALLSVLPEEWYGQGIEVHAAPTEAGLLSFALRWHGDRPALLWQLTVHADLAGVRIRAPGLDPSWSSVEARGEALFGSPPGAAVAAAGRSAGPGAGDR